MRTAKLFHFLEEHNEGESKWEMARKIQEETLEGKIKMMIIIVRVIITTI